MPRADDGHVPATANNHVDWDARLQDLRGAYSKNTIRAYREDFGAFENWCRVAHKVFLPASPETVAAYAEVLAIDLTPATIGRKWLASDEFIECSAMQILPRPIWSQWSCVASGAPKDGDRSRRSACLVDSATR